MIRIVSGGIFAFSGWSKLTRPAQEFEYMIEQYQTVPTMFIPCLARMLPWVEFIFGAFLIIGFLRMISARVLGFLSIAFLILLASTMLRGMNLGHCGCFGEGIHLTVPQAIVLDSCLAFIFAFFSVKRSGFFELDGWLQRGLVKKNHNL